MAALPPAKKFKVYEDYELKHEHDVVFAPVQPNEVGMVPSYWPAIHAVMGITEEDMKADSKMVFFHRDPVVKLNKHLDDYFAMHQKKWTLARSFTVFGAPGSGKTLACWVKALELVSENPAQSVLFVHQDKLDISACLIQCRDASDPTKLTLSFGDPVSADLFEFSSPAGPLAAIFYDGVVEADRSGWVRGSQLRNENERCPLIFCSSLGGAKSPEDHDAGLWSFHFAYWLPHEYETVFKRPSEEIVLSALKKLKESEERNPLVDTPDPLLVEMLGKAIGHYDESSKIDDAAELTMLIEEIVSYKFFYAGMSARWFFCASIAKIQTMVEEYYLPRLESEKPALSADAIHHLQFGHLPGHYKVLKNRCWVSEFVSRHVLKAKRESLLPMCYALLPELAENPSFLGWVLEAQYFQTMDVGTTSVGGQIQLKLKGADPENEHSEFAFEGNKRDFFFAYPPKLDTTVDGTKLWYFPVKWNQGAYDFFHLNVASNTLELTFFQVTRAKKHTMKSQFFYEAIASLLGYEPGTGLVDLLANNDTSGKLKEAFGPIMHVHICVVVLMEKSGGFEAFSSCSGAHPRARFPYQERYAVLQ